MYRLDLVNPGIKMRQFDGKKKHLHFYFFKCRLLFQDKMGVPIIYPKNEKKIYYFLRYSMVGDDRVPVLSGRYQSKCMCPDTRYFPIQNSS